MSAPVYGFTAAVVEGVDNPRELLNHLDVFQATRLRSIMGEGKLTLSQFTEAVFRAVGSVALYRHRPVAEAALEVLFRICDLDGDRRVTVADLPLSQALIGDPVALANGRVTGSPVASAAAAGHPTGSRQEREVVVYNDLATTLQLPVLDRTAGDATKARRSTAAVRAREATAATGVGASSTGDGGVGAQAAAQRALNEYLAELDLSKCSGLSYHACLDRHTLVNGPDVIVFALNGFATGMADVRLLSGRHVSPVLTATHIPHLRKLVTAGADRAIVAWAGGDRFEAMEQVRSLSPQTCIAYDPLAQLLVTGGTDGIISLFPALPQIGHCIRTVPAHAGTWITGLQFLPDIGAFATCGDDGVLRLWERQTFEERTAKTVSGIAPPPGAASEPATTAKSNGQGLALMSSSRALRCLFTTGQHGRRVLMWSPFLPAPTETLGGHDKPIVCATSFHDSAELITADQTGRICIWDMRKTMTVQVLGAPDGVSPIGRLAACSYDVRRNALVTLGDRINVFLPQRGGGAQTSMVDSPISAVLCCRISRRLFLASAGRLLIFELTTGQLLFEHAVGSLDISTMALTLDTHSLMLGSYEGTVLVLRVGTWQVAQRLSGDAPVALVVDLGLGHRLGAGAPDFSWGVAICTNGDIWRFPHGPMCQAASSKAVLLRTGIEDGIAHATFSTRHGYAILCPVGNPVTNAVVWDTAVAIAKPSLGIRLDPATQGSITAIEVVDAVEATFVGTSLGHVRAYATATSVCVATVCLDGGSGSIIPTGLRFASEPWRLAVMAQEAVTSLDLSHLTRLVAQHQAAASVRFINPKPTVRKRYEADLGTGWNHGWMPHMLRCMRRPTKTERQQQQQQGPTTGGSNKSKGAAAASSNDGSLTPADITAVNMMRCLFVCVPAAVFKPPALSPLDELVQQRPAGRVPLSSAFASPADVADQKKHRTAQLVRRIQLLGDAAPSAADGATTTGGGDGGWAFVARVYDLYVPSSTELVMEHGLGGAPMPAYVCTQRLCRSLQPSGPIGGAEGHTSWAAHFDSAAEVADAALARPDLRAKALDELRWFARCTAGALEELRAAGVQPFLDPAHDMAWDGAAFRLLPSQGVWPSDGTDDPDQRVDLDPARHPPEGWAGSPTAASNLWGLGLFLFRVATGRHVFALEKAKLADVQHTFERAFNRADPESAEDAASEIPYKPLFSMDQLTRSARPCYRQTWVLTLIAHLLCPAAHRWSVEAVVGFLEAPPPAHLVRCRLPTRHDLADSVDGLVIDLASDDAGAAHASRAGLLSPVATPPLPNANFTALAMSDAPPLYLAALFGQSAHVVALSMNGEAVGIVPAINEMRVPWSVDAVELNAATFDARFTQPESLAAADDGDGGGAQQGSKSSPRKPATASVSVPDRRVSGLPEPAAASTVFEQSLLGAESFAMALDGGGPPPPSSSGGGKTGGGRDVGAAIDDGLARVSPFYASILEGRREAGVSETDLTARPSSPARKARTSASKDGDDGEDADDGLPYYLSGWYKVAGGRLDLLRRGTSREMSALEERVHLRRRNLATAREYRIAKEKERGAASVQASPGMLRDHTPPTAPATTTAGAHQQQGPSKRSTSPPANAMTPERRAGRSGSVLSGGSTSTAVHRKGQSEYARLLEAPIRGLDLPADPAFMLRRPTPAGVRRGGKPPALTDTHHARRAGTPSAMRREGRSNHPASSATPTLGAKSKRTSSIGIAGGLPPVSAAKLNTSGPKDVTKPNAAALAQ